MPIIYYDGNCVYCYNYAIWLIRHGLSKSYEFATLKGPSGEALQRQHPGVLELNTVVLQEGVRLYFKSTAIAKLLMSLTEEKWLGLALTLVPKPLRNLGYNLFANNRDKMWHATWQKPSDYERSFFIDLPDKIKKEYG
ncbi:DCC1-like thiol-disulfide oxidoreductase family protein [Staphylococcus sp. EZ-P03]|uniref:thiol-disulfide oxidoreductase DCC family protein n=1 Tax=Staphylococcus sp. EZ-P03 TaxID=2282739 RepID=UPI000DF76D66|nr:DCC1-like thiol-disulfide oxidoreductase family protein [Staphylococcus sp. EZ-P03]